MIFKSMSRCSGVMAPLISRFHVDGHSSTPILVPHVAAAFTAPDLACAVCHRDEAEGVSF
jgi:hypothetical protein